MILWVMIFISQLALAFSPTSQTTCTDIDLRSQILGKVKNQGEISWCYAFTASDILKYGFNLDQRVSAADVALRFNHSFIGKLMDTIYSNGTPHETGFNKSALQQGMRDGVCPESAFPSEKWVKVTGEREEIVLMPKAIEEINSLFHQKKYQNLEKLPFYYRFKHVDEEKFSELLNSKNLKNFYENLRNSACGPERIELSNKYKVRMKIRNKKIFNRINEVLSNGMIVGIDYDSRVLTNKDHRGIKISELHTSSIVGRRWNSDSRLCEYLIRDSKGDACLGYDPSYECEDGNVWLGESIIFNGLTSIVYLDNL